MSVDPELQRWRAQWQTDTQHVPTGLRERVKRESRRMRLMLYADLVITVIAGSLGTVWAMASERPAMRFLAIWVWTSLLITWMFRLMNDKGNWSGAAPDTEAFLHLSVRRRRASLRAVKFGLVLYLAQMAVVSSCVYWEGNRQSPMNIWTYLILTRSLVVWFCAAVFLLWMIWYGRGKKAELEHLLKIQQDWDRYADEWDVSVSTDRKERKWAALGSLIRSHISSLSQLDEFAWGIRRKKKIWKM
jgi:hypothetical protein